MSDNFIRDNKAVFFIYTVTDNLGELLEQSDLPVGYVHGVNNRMLPKLAQSLAGHKEGERLEVNISPEEGFGPLDPDLIYKEKVDNVPAEFRVVGAQPQFKNDKGDVKTFMVTHVDKDEVTMDGNHPYAGKTIVFNVTIKEVRDASMDEITSGEPVGAGPAIH